MQRPIIFLSFLYLLLSLIFLNLVQPKMVAAATQMPILGYIDPIEFMAARGSDPSAMHDNSQSATQVVTALTKRASAAIVNTGDTVTYTLSFTNTTGLLLQIGLTQLPAGAAPAGERFIEKRA